MAEHALKLGTPDVATIFDFGLSERRMKDFVRHMSTMGEIYSIGEVFQNGIKVPAIRRRKAPPVVGGGSDPNKLTWSPPVLSNPVTQTLTNAARSVPFGPGGTDRRLLCGQVLTAAVGETNNYANVVAIAGEFNSTGSPQSSGHIIPRRITGIWHIEGWKMFSALAGDFITSRQRANIIQVQACDVNVTEGGIDYHADGFQTQITQITELRYDRCTIRSDWQGWVLINESPIPSSPDPSFVTKTILKRCMMRKGQLQFGMTMFLSKPPKPGNVPLGVIELYDVWMEDGSICYPHTDGNQWDGGGSAGRFCAYRINKLHANGQTYPFWRFSVAGDTMVAGPFAGQAAHDCNVRGDGGVWIFPANGQPPAGLGIGAPTGVSTPGMSYVTPGYQ